MSRRITADTSPPGQLGLALARPAAKPKHGGERKGAGRPANKNNPKLPHIARPFHDKNHPVHITMRIQRGVRSLRRYDLCKAVFKSFRRLADKGPRTGTFRVVHFSVQPNHLHLIVEAGSKRSLGRGLMGLGSSIARRVNNKLGRRGRLFAERYHARPLATPLEVRRCVVYVLQNAQHHAEDLPDLETMAINGLDPCSSGPWADVWARPPPTPNKPPPVSRPESWLLRRG